MPWGAGGSRGREMGDGRWEMEMGDGRWEMGDGRWEMGDGTQGRSVSGALQQTVLPVRLDRPVRLDHPVPPVRPHYYGTRSGLTQQSASCSTVSANTRAVAVQYLDDPAVPRKRFRNER